MTNEESDISSIVKVESSHLWNTNEPILIEDSHPSVKLKSNEIIPPLSD